MMRSHENCFSLKSKNSTCYTLFQKCSPVRITESPDYIHTETGGTSVYYRSQCWVSVPVSKLGEGTHRFQAYIYPDVTDGESLVEAVTLNATVNLCEFCDCGNHQRKGEREMEQRESDRDTKA